MKYFWILAIALFATPASAGHHRVHALDFIDKGCETLVLAQKDLDNWRLHQSDPIDWLIDNVQGHLNFLYEDCEDLQFMLETPNYDLEIIRRRLNQPFRSGARSSITFFWAMTYEMGYSIHHRTDISRLGYKSINRFIRTASQAWRWFDLAIWHVTDTIREETYLDPDFM